MAYDEIGNPLYIGYTSDGEIFDSAYELIWEGRQLVTHRYREYYYEDDIEYFDEVTYTYNADGIRTSKTVEGIKHEYILNGSQIIAETWTESGVEYVLFYFYDETGAPLGIRYRTSNYAANDYDYFYFEKNLQGDIVAVYNESGTQIGLYYYDAWGNFTTYSFGSTGLERYIVEDYNPFRYRGYYYDIETGYYYLQSRYYNPVWGRFINSDEVTYLGANGDLQAFNLFTYCSNNSVVGYDPTGKWTFSIGWSFSAFLLGGATYSISLAFDSSGNIALQTTKADVFQKESGGTFGIVAAGVSKSYSYTSLDTIEDLEGAALNTGGSIPVYGPLSAGGEVISSPSAPTEVVGGNISIGVGVGIDAHVTASVTNTVAQFNIIDGAKNVWNMATGWIGGWLFA